MLFNSFEFIFLFLPITLYIYFYLNRFKLIELSKGFLVLSSLFFYSWWNIIYLPLLLLSILFNFLIAKTLSKSTSEKIIRKKIILVFGIIMNILLLSYFKYYNFFIENIDLILGTKFVLVDLALPLAISFFTFQQIAYLVDSYKQEIKEFNFLNYTIFVTFFPQLIAGPIVHHKEMMPQFIRIKNKFINFKNITLGLYIFSIGLFKKVVIADYFALWANKGFDNTSILNFYESWITSLSYTFQLYFDFSGYTDMAIGLALLFNIKIPINFNSPYKALNIQDFWRRWHITLSRFLREYIYIPLGGNRKSSFSTYRNLIATFIIGGLWHGAGWTFLFWGLIHAIALSIHKLWQSFDLILHPIIAWFITFNFINISWIFFRAERWEDAINIIKAMFDFEQLTFNIDYTFNYTIIVHNILINSMEVSNIITWLILGFIISIYFNNSIEKMHNFKLRFYNIIFIFLLFYYSLFSMISNKSQFLYFNF